VTREKPVKLRRGQFRPNTDAISGILMYDRCTVSEMRCKMIEWLDRISNEGGPACLDTRAIREPVETRQTTNVEKMVMALAAGALLGALASMPYDQLLGVSQPACTILRSVLTTAVWAGLGSERVRDLTFDPGALLGVLSTRQTSASCRLGNAR